MKYWKLLAELERGWIAPLYLFVGEEDFLKEEAIRRIRAALIDPATQAFNLDVFYGGDAEMATVVNVASSPPMLAERRLVILREVDRLSPPDRRLLLSYAENPSPTTCLILIGPKVDLERGFFAQLNQQAVTVVFWRLFDNQIPGWIQGRVRERGKGISAEGVTLLQERVGNDLWALDNEIEKLLLYIGPKERIDLDDVKAVAGESKVDTVFGLADAIGDRNLARSLRILGKMLETGESPVAMVSMLTRYFTTLLKIRELDRVQRSSQQMAKMANVRQFLINGYIRRSRNFSIFELKRSFDLLLKADTHLKTSYQRPKMVMELLVYRLCKRQGSLASLQREAKL